MAESTAVVVTTVRPAAQRRRHFLVRAMTGVPLLWDLPGRSESTYEGRSRPLRAGTGRTPPGEPLVRCEAPQGRPGGRNRPYRPGPAVKVASNSRLRRTAHQIRGRAAMRRVAKAPSP